MLLPLKTFTGEFPRTNSYLIADNAAQAAIDCDFLAGSLRGIPSRDPVAGVSGTNIKSLFVYEGGASSGSTFWWQRDVDAVRSPVVNDQYARFYWSDGSGFYVSRGDLGGNGEPSTSNRYKVGVPRPNSAPEGVVTASEFSCNGFKPVGASAFCERSDGTRYNEVWLTNNVVDTNVLESWHMTSTVALACDAAGSTPTATTNTIPSGWTFVGNYPVGSPYATSTAPMYTDGTNFAIKYVSSDLPSNVAVYKQGAESVFDMMGTYVRLGSTYWYGSNAGISPLTTEGPTETASTSSATAGPAVDMKFQNADGVELHAIIRADGNTSTIPSELTGLGAAIAVSAGSISTSFWIKADYKTTRAYTYTYVNQYQEEGAPADPFIVTCGADAAVTLRYEVPPDGYCPVSKIRVYRTASTNGQYLYVGEALVNTTDPTFTDDVADSELGHTLDTQNYYPPDQALVGQRVMANGIMVGFKGNEVHFSEPYLPYAWSPSAIKPFPHRVVGICPFEGGLYVTTTAEPYIIQGAAPEYMTDMKVAAIQAGVSKNSIANYNGQVVYASHDGLVMMQGAQASLDMSFKFFTRKDWQDRYGSKLNRMRLNAHDGSLLVWFEDGTPGFLIRFEEESPSLTQLSEPVYAAFVYPVADALYVSNGNSVFAFRYGTSRNSFSWWSKDFIIPKPSNFGAVQLVGSGTVTLEVYADDVLRFTKSITMGKDGRTIERLPGGFLARRWSFKLSGDGEVCEFAVANTVAELQNV